MHYRNRKMIRNEGTLLLVCMDQKGHLDGLVLGRSRARADRTNLRPRSTLSGSQA